MTVNMLSLILVIFCLLTGILFFYDYFKLRPQRIKAYEDARFNRPDLTKRQLRQIREGEGLVQLLGGLFPIIFVIFMFRAFIYEPFRIPSGSMEPTLLPGDFIAVSKWSYGIRNPLNNQVWIETGSPERGDIVVFKYPEDPSSDYIKRVIGLPGDEVIFENKRIYIRKACNVSKVTVSSVEQSSESETPCVSPEAVPMVSAGNLVSEGKTYRQEFALFDETLGENRHRVQISTRAPDLSQYYYRQRGAMRGSWIVPEGHYFVMGDNRDNSKDSRFWGFVPEENLVGKAVSIWLSLGYGSDAEDSFLGLPSEFRFNRIGTIE